MERFDATAGSTFGTYAFYWVRKEVQRALAQGEFSHIELPFDQVVDIGYRMAVGPVRMSAPTMTAPAYLARAARGPVEVAPRALGRHLAHAVRTGSSRVYQPDPPIEWIAGEAPHTV